MINQAFRGSGFSFVVDNFGSAFGNAVGTSVTQGNQVKGSSTQLLVGIAEDCWYIEIFFCNGSSSATAFRMFADIQIDSAAGVGGNGSSWTTVIPNLASDQPDGVVMPGWRYGFPLFIPKGSAIAASVQANAAGSYNVGVRCYGKPQRPELWRTGSYVQALGITLGATNTGTAYTPGTNAKGSWSATLGTLSKISWWWQVAGLITTNTSMNASGFLVDVSFDSTSKYLAMQDVPVATTTTEQFGSFSHNGLLPIREAPAGVDVYIRAACCSGAPASTLTGAVYALGG